MLNSISLKVLDLESEGPVCLPLQVFHVGKNLFACIYNYSTLKGPVACLTLQDLHIGRTCLLSSTSLPGWKDLLAFLFKSSRLEGPTYLPLQVFHNGRTCLFAEKSNIWNSNRHTMYAGMQGDLAYHPQFFKLICRFRAIFAVPPPPAPLKTHILKCTLLNLLNNFSQHILSFDSNPNEEMMGIDISINYYNLQYLVCGRCVFGSLDDFSH